MSTPPHDNPELDRDPGDPAGLEEQDLHPAIDPREPEHAEPPPLDVDERERSETHVDTPDVIELSDHIDQKDTDPLSTDESLDQWTTHPEQPFTEPIDDGGSQAEASADWVSESESKSAPADTTEYFQPAESAGEEVPPSGEVTELNDPDRRGATAKIGGFMSGAASRLNLGRLLETTEQPGRQEKTGTHIHREPTDPASRAGLGSGVVRARESFRGFLDPSLHIPDIVPHRRFVLTAVGVALLFLLASSGGLALIVLATIAPLLVLMTITQHDVFEKESNVLISAIAAGGGVAGLIIGGLAAWVQDNRWFGTGKLNYGAGGFGGRWAEADGNAPFLAWFFVGLIVPALIIAAIAGIPISMRRWPQFRNEVMDGMILTGATAAGFVMGTNIVYWWPMLGGAGPQGDINEWTIRIIGMLLLRSLVIVLCGAMIGAGVWRYMMAGSDSRSLLPAIAGVLGILLLQFGSVQLQSSDIWAEFLWTALLVIASFALYRRALDDAIATDRAALGASEERVVCQSCHRVTPNRTFCAYCGHRLSEPAAEHEPEPVSDPADGIGGPIA
jgi:hypothetical protein